MQRSPITLEWEARGQVRATRAKLLRLLQLRFGADLPADLVQAVERQEEQAALDRWFDLAVTAPDLDQLLAVIANGGH